VIAVAQVNLENQYDLVTMPVKNRMHLIELMVRNLDHQESCRLLGY
jgi:hypothetical protein